jgi:hypothetical protein
MILLAGDDVLVEMRVVDSVVSRARLGDAI